MKFVTSLLISFLFSSVAAAGDFTSLCAKFGNAMPGGYCIYLSSGGTSNDILYYLHGKDNSENTWGDEWFFTSQLRTEWKNQDVKPPIIVSVSFGPRWVLANKNSSEFSGLLEAFTMKIMPLIEAQLKGVTGRRMVMGDSMGGFNSAQLALKTDLFSKAAIICAPMSEVSPYAPRSEVDAHVRNSSAYHYYGDDKARTVMNAVHEAIELVHTFFPTPADWAKANPLELGGNLDRAKTTKFYVTIGMYDKYAAYEANEKFAELLRARGMDVDWRPQWGGHCAIDIPSLAKFLTAADAKRKFAIQPSKVTKPQL